MKSLVFSNGNRVRVEYKTSLGGVTGSQFFIMNIVGLNDFEVSQATLPNQQGKEYNIQDFINMAEASNLKLTIEDDLTSTTLSDIVPFTFTTATSLTAGTHDVVYSNSLVVAGGGSRKTFTVAEGNSLPAGLTLSGDGVVSGTPTTANSYSFDIDCTDNYGEVLTKAFTLVIV